MSFILVPKHGEDVQINGWNWRPTLELLLEENLISLDNYERMGAQAVGGHVDAETANRIADVIERKLMTMKTVERMLPDLTFTAEPKTKWVITPETKPDEFDPADFYSASYEWLVTFAAFCRRSDGFEVW